jgi:hypothetical protein
MTAAMRRPCFEGETEDLMCPDECQESRYAQFSDPRCSWLVKGNHWETCNSGRKHGAYAAWRELQETEPCSRCHGTGRVRRRGR